MYQEYPDDPRSWSLENQFMWGSSILVCPKIQQKFVMPNENISDLFINRESSPMYEINPVIFDLSYNWNTKEAMKGSYQLFLLDEQIPIFIKHGSILTLMNVHENDKRCLSLEDCYENSVTI